MAWKSKWLQNFIFPKNALLIAHDSFDLNSKLSIVNKMYIWSIFWNPLTKRESLDALNNLKDICASLNAMRFLYQISVKVFVLLTKGNGCYS